MKGMSKFQELKSTMSGNSDPSEVVHLGDPALEFIKYVSAVLALDQNVQHEVLVMHTSFASMHTVVKIECSIFFPL